MMSNLRTIFQSKENEQFFNENGYLVFDLLSEDAIEELHAFYRQEFPARREVIPQAKDLPYYISIFDADSKHKKDVDAIIGKFVERGISQLMHDYEVFYSNYMIKFPDDGEIEAHQDFNFVDETAFTAFNLWSPLVDTSSDNGGLYVIPGSHRVFMTQRGPNLPKALTQYNQMMKRYAQLIPVKKGQAIIFDHKLIHHSPPNHSQEARVAIQSVLKPKEATALHYFFNEKTQQINAFQIDKDYILNNNLWKGSTEGMILDHEQELLPFPNQDEVINHLIQLKLQKQDFAKDPYIKRRDVFLNKETQKDFLENGFVKLQILNEKEIEELKNLFLEFSGGEVENTEYGIYISLEEDDVSFKKQLIQKVSDVALAKVEKNFIDCKPHLGSFLVKAPGQDSYTFPHQDWSFVDTPEFCSVTIWIALVDTDESNGTLGFIPGSHRFFAQTVGSPSPEYKTYTQGHEELLYEYLKFIPLKAGEAIAFDNRTIHGATPNLSNDPRVAVAIGMTPKEADLHHYFLNPQWNNEKHRQTIKLSVNQDFFHHYSVKKLKATFDKGQIPNQILAKRAIMEEFIPFSRKEIEEYLRATKQQANGRKLQVGQPFRPRSLFKDIDLQNTFEEKGYCIIPVLSGEEVEQLRLLYNQKIRQDAVTGLYESSRNNEYDVNKEINDAIHQAFQTAFEKYFVFAKLYGGTFMTKSHKDSDILPLHQDWSVVDEDKYSTLFIWCPLQETNAENGGLFVLDGSHHYFNVLRSGSYPSNRYPLPDDLQQYVKNIHLKPGEAIIYSDQLFHGSYANTSTKDRVVVTARVMDQDAPLVYFHKRDENHTDVYEGTPEFYLSQIDRIAKGQAPLEVPILYTKEYQHSPITDEGLQFQIKKHFQKAVLHSEEVQHDKNLSFWEIYTPANIFREIRNRVMSK